MQTFILRETMKDETQMFVRLMGDAALFALFFPILTLVFIGLGFYEVLKAGLWLRQAFKDFWTVNYDEQAHRFWKQ